MSVLPEMSSWTALEKQLGSSPALRLFLTQRSQVGCVDLGLFGLREHSKSVQVQKHEVCGLLTPKGQMVPFSVVRTTVVHPGQERPELAKRGRRGRE